jgi:hypothetical protein
MSDPAHVNILQNQEEPEVDYSDCPQNDPFKHLQKSTMNLSLCKNDYYVCRDKGENYFQDKFWSSFDKDGFSVHHGFYKYNDEFSPLAFIRRNVVTGIIQSMDSTIAHKNLFGVFKLYNNKQLECMFITRGDTMSIECAGDMVESFEWKKLDTDNDNIRKNLSEFFNSETADNIEFFNRFV